MDMNESTEPPNTPWYESNLLWVPFSLAFGIILTVVAGIEHDLRWLLWCAWPFFGASIWRIAQRTREVWIVFLLGVILVGAGLWWLSNWLKPEQTVTTVVPTPQPTPKNPAPEPQPQAKPAPKFFKPTAPPKALPAPLQQGNGGAVGGGITAGPCSKFQVGGSNNNASVDCGQPSRRLTDSEINDLASCLSKDHGDVNIMVPQGDAEAYAFAEDWLKVFHKAEWTIKDDSVHQGIYGGGFWTGTRIQAQGTINSDGASATYAPQSVGTEVFGCMLGRNFPGRANGIPQPEFPPKHVEFWVGPRPSQ
jgi:hypothetical protein